MTYASVRPVSSYVSATTRSRIAVGFLILAVISEVAAVIGGISQGGMLSRAVVEGGISPAEAEANDSRMTMIGIFQMVAFWSSAIAFLSWLHRANRTARSFGAAYMEYTPAWTVGWWFVPIANLFKPFQAVSEIWRASSPESTDASSWQAESTPPILYAWWGLWIVSNILSNIYLRMTFGSKQDATLPDLIAMTNVGIADGVLSVIAGMLAITVVAGVNKRQQRKAIILQRAVAHAGYQGANPQANQPAFQAPPQMDPVAHYNRGVGYYQANDMARAVQEYQEAIRLNPNFAEAHYSLGLAYLAMGNREAAALAAGRLQSISLDWAHKLNQLIHGR